ncbi:MAG: cation diffusion facilitator family transporter, partial [Elusimicrobiota bacterium]|nr:cation diffusion facilitator family transporter [Elusimicrobiota bacterium]
PVFAALAAAEAPAPDARERSAESRAAESALLFDGATLAAADAPEVPGGPPSAGPARDGGGLKPAAPRPRRVMNHRLLGSRRQGDTAVSRAGLTLVRLTGARAAWLLYRDGILLQRHASRLRDLGQKDSARAASARLLAEIGAVEAAPLLAWAREHDPSPRVRAAAAAGLLLMTEHAVPKLVGALRTRLTGAGREGAAEALGWLVAEADAPAALQALGSAAVLDRSEGVRLAAIRALGRAESPRAVKLLFWVQAHAAHAGQRAAVEAALREHERRQESRGRVFYQPPVDDFGEVSSPLQSSALKRSVAVGLFFAALEFAGGVFTGNAALKADALHLAGDRLLDATGLFALFLARRPPTGRRTYGFIKAEAVFALLGAMVIAGVALGMAPDAWTGLVSVWSWLFAGGAALEGAGWAVAGYASLGLVSNLFSGYLLMRHKEGSMTARAAFLHVMADAMGSGGIILSTALGALFGWTFLQPFVLAAIIFLILRTAWELGVPAWNVLMDAVPPGLDLDKLEADLLSVPGVAGVHDLHVRMLNGVNAELAAKATVAAGADRDAVLAALQALLRERYKIAHATIQLEAAR